MISAILNGNPWLIPAFITVGTCISVAMIYAARRWALQKGVAVLFGLTFAAELTATLYPSYTGAGSSGICTFNRDLFSPLVTQQGIMNVAMFAPLILLAAFLFRSPASALASGIALSGATELAQGLIPGIGRSCATEDFMANSLGSAVGVAVALAARRIVLNRQREMDRLLPEGDMKRGVRIAGIGGIAILSIGLMSLTPVAAEVSELTHASSSQQQEAERIVRHVLGDAPHISSVQRMSNTGGRGEQVLVTLDNGFINFMNGDEFITGSTNASSLPGIKNRKIKSDRDAIVQATVFVRTRFPWALKQSAVSVHPTVRGTGQRTVAWRQRVEGVLMPMRMDVVVEPNGRISAFTGRNEKAPSTPPPHKITAAQARSIGEENFGDGEFKSAELLVQRNNEGVWETRWGVNFTMSGGVVRTVIIHANSGEILDLLG